MHALSSSLLFSQMLLLASTLLHHNDAYWFILLIKQYKIFMICRTHCKIFWVIYMSRDYKHAAYITQIHHTVHHGSPILAPKQTYRLINKPVVLTCFSSMVLVLMSLMSDSGFHLFIVLHVDLTIYGKIAYGLLHAQLFKHKRQ